MIPKGLNVHATSFQHHQGQQVDTLRGLLETNSQVGHQVINGDVMGNVTPVQDSTQTLNPNKLHNPQANLNQNQL